MAIPKRAAGRRRRAPRPHRRLRRPADAGPDKAADRLIDTESQRLAHVGSWEWDVARNVVAWSDELYRIYGLRCEEFSGTYEGFLDHVHLDDRSYAREVIAAAFRQAKPFAYDHRIVRGDGAVRMLQTRGGVVRGPGGSVLRLLGCCMDVTEQWETRRCLEESTALLRATFDSTADGIFVIDLSGKVAACNRRALELWKVPEALAAAGDLQALIEYARDQLIDPEGFVAREWELKSNLEARGLDVILFKDGRVFERYTQPQRLGGAVVGRVCSFRDVTRRERAMADLKKLAAELEERVRERTAQLTAKARELARSNAELEMFAAASSHDLRAPARKISAFAQLLERRAAGRLEPEERDMLGRIGRAASDMNKLMDDLLALSRAAREPLPVEDVDLNAVLRDVLSDLELILAKAGGSVKSQTLPVVRGHASLWRSLLANLISNAVKFRAPDRSPRVAISARDGPGGGVIIAVEDNGIGFASQFAKDVFQPFRRLNPKSQYEGSGIGLAICERIARRYGGEMSVRSEVGRGSTFFVYMPPEALART